MTEQEKDLLLKDLYARLPYGVKVYGNYSYSDGDKIVDDITQDDLIIAFFPCIYFEAMQANYYSMRTNNLYKCSRKKAYEVVLNRIEKREIFYKTLYKMFAVCELKGLRLIFENPATKPHYLFHSANFIPPTFIDRDRTRRGDYYKKPTAYWYVNCKPTYGESYQKDKERKIIQKCKRSKGAGLCSEERSMISPDYARNFICDFILGKTQRLSQLNLFE